jgi:hypothetical protein
VSGGRQLTAERCLFGVSGARYDDCVVLRTFDAGRDELLNHQNPKQMQFIVGVNFRGHAVEGTKTPKVCNFLF